jgi:carotenoid cleavage dioxygenase-like enzyme
MALWYISGKPVRVDPRTLATIGNEDFAGKLPRSPKPKLFDKAVRNLSAAHL